MGGNTPPSRVSSEGGGSGGASTEEYPLHLAFRAREGVEVVDASGLRFEQGRG